MKPHHYTIWVVTQVTAALWVQVNMPFGSYMLTTVKQKVFVAFVRFHSSLLLWCSVNRISLSFLQTTTCRLLRLYKMDINHLLNMFDFKATQCTFFFWMKKHSEPKWIVSSWDQDAGVHVYPLCYSSPQARFLSFYFPFPVSIPSNRTQTFSDLQTHPSNPVHIKTSEFENKLKAIFPTTHTICGVNLFQIWTLKWKNVHFPFVASQVSFQHTFLFHSSSLLAVVFSSHVHSFSLCPLLRAQQESTL